MHLCNDFLITQHKLVHVVLYQKCILGVETNELGEESQAE